MLPETIRTARLLLRPIQPRDAGAIFDAYASDPEVTRYLTWRPHRDRAETEAYIAHCLAPSSPASRTYIILEEAVLRGAIDLRMPERHGLEVGYVLARPAWGRGLMTEALQEIVRWALAKPGIYRIGATCDVDNLASARVMEKAGMTREVLLRRWAIHPNQSNEPRDCLSYAATR